MNINKSRVKIFKIKNRDGFAAVYANHLTEGRTPQQAYDRLLKAVNRTRRKKK